MGEVLRWDGGLHEFTRNPLVPDCYGHAGACHEGDDPSLREAFAQRKGYSCPSLLRSVLTQLSSAVGYLHAQRVVHRDLKPQNILLHRETRAGGSPENNGIDRDNSDPHRHGGDDQRSVEELRVILCDLGSAVALAPEAQRLTDTDGTPWFFAPEMCLGEGYDGYRSDAWALGVCGFALMFGRLPFFAESAYAVLETIVAEESVGFGPHHQ